MLEYLRTRIFDELNDAIDYMMKAVEHKGTQCGQMFYEIAKMETEHANAFYSMFSKQSKPEELPEAKYSEMLKGILDKYMTDMAKFEALKKLYYSK